MTVPFHRSLDLYRLVAALVFLAAIIGLYRIWEPDSALIPAPVLADGPALYRPDGGQALGSGGSLKPNDLSHLNLGYRLNLTTTHPKLLATLPGLGDKSAITARTKGCLSIRAHKRLEGLIKETCNRSNL